MLTTARVPSFLRSHFLSHFCASSLPFHLTSYEDITSPSPAHRLVHDLPYGNMAARTISAGSRLVLGSGCHSHQQCSDWWRFGWNWHLEHQPFSMVEWWRSLVWLTLGMEQRGQRHGGVYRHCGHDLLGSGDHCGGPTV